MKPSRLSTVSAISAVTLFAVSGSAPAPEAFVNRVAANCAEFYFPDLSVGPVAYAGIPAPAPARDVSGWEIESKAAPGMPEGARLDVYRNYADSTGYVSVAYAAASGACTRMTMEAPDHLFIPIIKGPTLENGSHPTSIIGKQPPAPNDEFPPAKFERAVVTVTNGGQPMRSHPVDFYTVPYGDPGNYGSGIGHEHNWYWRSETPSSIRIQDGKNSKRLGVGQEHRVNTNEYGRIELFVRGNYRGAVESLGARTRIDGTPHEVMKSFVIKIPAALKHFNDAFPETRGMTTEPPKSAKFPFMLVGEAAKVHVWTHYFRKDKADRFGQALRRVWELDMQKRFQGPESKYWMQINDGTLEYGGNLKCAPKERELCDTDKVNGCHGGHNQGRDVDMTPCYSPNGAYIDATTCYNVDPTRSVENARKGNVHRINQALLKSLLMDSGIALIYTHPHRYSGSKLIEPYHYHLRLR